MYGQFQQNVNPYSMGYPKYPQYTTNNGIVWVQGIEGAKAYQLAPNSNVVLLDSDNEGIFYIKVSDNVGMCNLRTFNFVEVTNQPQQPPAVSEVDMSNYVTKEELQEALQAIKGGNKNVKQAVSTVESNAK